MTPEQQARQQIDAQLLASGWAVQDYTKIDFSAGRGIALREVPLKSGTCDYLLLVDRKPVGVVEAKKEGTLLTASPSNLAIMRRIFLTSSPPRSPVRCLSFTNPPGSKPFFAMNATPTRAPGRCSAFIAPKTIRRELLKQADVHTLLRLPTGIFYAQGVKANVLFFDRKPAQEKSWTQKLWIYDLRINLHFTLKENTLKRTDLDDFVACYFGRAGSPLAIHRSPLPAAGAHGVTRPTLTRHERKETERFKSFTYEELTKRDKVNLDIFWLKDDALEESANLPAPEIIAQEITDDLEAALEQFSTITEDLKK